MRCVLWRRVRDDLGRVDDHPSVRARCASLLEELHLLRPAARAGREEQLDAARLASPTVLPRLGLQVEMQPLDDEVAHGRTSLNALEREIVLDGCRTEHDRAAGGMERPDV